MNILDRWVGRRGRLVGDYNILVNDLKTPESNDLLKIHRGNRWIKKNKKNITPFNQ